ncbi:YkgJ family cysteine cluster protein [Treponema sp.]|uniref:YkgJ family cysteine cluster protein n=1 Tax=Treponema sp. TaxID=166 RepID=UPI003F11AC5C
MDSLFEFLKDTHEGKLAADLKVLYENLEKQQAAWYTKTKFTCPDGCGMCCHNFEPDLTEPEADFMAVWLLQNQRAAAEKLLENPPDSGRTCIFFNKENPWHCSIYGARPFVCRLFGGSCFYSKSHGAVWRPCKFYPEERLKNFGLLRRQYRGSEIVQILGAVPPVMSDVMSQALSLSPENTSTAPLREILPAKIQHILFLIKCLS